LCFLLVPTQGWRGAAIASYAAQGTLVLLLGISIRRLTSRSAAEGSDSTVRSD
jgi:hypothetical protein